MPKKVPFPGTQKCHFFPLIVPVPLSPHDLIPAVMYSSGLSHIILATEQAQTACGFLKIRAPQGPVCLDNRPTLFTALAFHTRWTVRFPPAPTHSALIPTLAMSWLLKSPPPRISSPSYLPAPILGTPPLSAPPLTLYSDHYFST